MQTLQICLVLAAAGATGGRARRKKRLTSPLRHDTINSVLSNVNALTGKNRTMVPLAESRRMVQGGAGASGYWPLSGKAERSIPH